MRYGTFKNSSTRKQQLKELKLYQITEVSEVNKSVEGNSELLFFCLSPTKKGPKKN